MNKGAENIFMTIENKKWTWAGRLHITDKKSTTKVTEWPPRNEKS